MDVLSHIRLKTCTTAAEAPAFPPPSAFLDAFLRIAFQSTGAAVAAASDIGTVELIVSAFVGIVTVAAIVAAMTDPKNSRLVEICLLLSSSDSHPLFVVVSALFRDGRLGPYESHPYDANRTIRISFWIHGIDFICFG